MSGPRHLLPIPAGLCTDCFPVLVCNCGRLVDRFAERPDLVHAPSVAWQPTDPAPLPQSYLAAVDAYLAGDRDTVAQQRGAL